MNIFYTNNDPFICATEHCTIHSRKMIVEYTQLLSTAHHVLDGDDALPGIYKATHVNHPSAIWVRESAENYRWVWWLAALLCEQYERHSGKKHACDKLLLWLFAVPKNIQCNGDFPNTIGTELSSLPPKCMPDEYKVESVEESYKNYLNAKYREWLDRDKPLKVEWWTARPEWVIL